MQLIEHPKSTFVFADANTEIVVATAQGEILFEMPIGPGKVPLAVT